MFEEFSKKFEASFRTFFMYWVSFWFVINLVNLGFNYANFESFSDSEVIAWLFNIIGQVISITLGIFLIFVMSGVPKIMKKKKKIKSVPVIAGMAVGYYLVANVLFLGAVLITDPSNAFREFVFQLGWLLPSVVLLIVHILYTLNLGAYNEELEEKENTEK